MAYLAIARKYRPATFDEMVGQDHVTRTLRNAIATGRIHHAYLFTGARGVGKTTAARALARALNCERGPTADPCGACTSCLEVGTGSSPDLIEIDGASNNSVEDVREIRDGVAYAPTRGKWKIYLIDEVHMLSKGAFNALLKTLEEPPPHVVFIFATTEAHKIPDTILSRVQRFDFKRIAAPKVVDRLAEIARREGVQIGESGLRLVARAGEGSMRDAQSLLDQIIASAGTQVSDAQVTEILGLVARGALYDFVRALVHGQPAVALEIIDRVYAWGHDLDVFAEEILEILRHATFLILAPEARRYIDLADEDVAQIRAACAGADSERLSRLFSAFADVHAQVARAGRPRLVLEMAVARLATIRPALPAQTLLDRLDQMEKNLRGTGPARAPAGWPPAPARPPASEPDRPAPATRPTARAPQTRPARPEGPSGDREPSPPAARPAPPEPAAVRAPEPPPVARRPPEARPARHAPEPIDEIDEPPPRTDEVGWSPDPDEDDDGSPFGPLPLGNPTPRAQPVARVIHRIVPTRAVQSAQTSPAPPSDPAFEAFCAAMRALGDAFVVFTRGTPIPDGRRLRLALNPGPDLARATLLNEDPRVAGALRAGYPAMERLDLEARAIVGHVDAAQLEREFRSDPALRRILEALDARIEGIEPPHDPSEPTPPAAAGPPRRAR